MAAIEWFRLWHDMPNDPKWRTVARVSGQPISLVLAVALHLMVSASEGKERGTYSILEEDIASALNESDEAVCAVVTAMQGRVLDGKRLTAWERRQPTREDGAEGRGKNPGSNYIYYVADTGRDVVKIGISRNPWSRVKDIQVGSSSKFELLATLKTSERSEQAIHKFFQVTRLEGEWFSRSPALNSLIQKTISKEIGSFENAIAYLSSLPVDAFVVATVAAIRTVVATKDTETETDKDTDKKTEETTTIDVTPYRVREAESSSAPQPVTKLSHPAEPDKIPATTTRVGDIAKLLKANGADPASHPSSKGVADMVALNLTDTEILLALQTAKQNRQAAGNPQAVTAAYVLGIAKGQRQDRQKAARSPPDHRSRYAEQSRQIAELSAQADAVILAQKSQASPQPAEIDMGVIDASPAT